VKNITTYVGVDAHKKDLFIAMLIGDERTPDTWTVPNEPNAVTRLVRKLERAAPGPVRVCYEAGPVWLRAAAAGDYTAGELSGDRPGARSSEAGRPD
jgi:hypothetical protein